jgi:hypothetical protein
MVKMYATDIVNIIESARSEYRTTAAAKAAADEKVSVAATSAVDSNINTQRHIKFDIDSSQSSTSTITTSKPTEERSLAASKSTPQSKFQFSSTPLKLQVSVLVKPIPNVSFGTLEGTGHITRNNATEKNAEGLAKALEIKKGLSLVAPSFQTLVKKRKADAPSSLSSSSSSTTTSAQNRIIPPSKNTTQHQRLPPKPISSIVQVSQKKPRLDAEPSPISSTHTPAILPGAPFVYPPTATSSSPSGDGKKGRKGRAEEVFNPYGSVDESRVKGGNRATKQSTKANQGRSMTFK